MDNANSADIADSAVGNQAPRTEPRSGAADTRQIDFAELDRQLAETGNLSIDLENEGEIMGPKSEALEAIDEEISGTDSEKAGEEEDPGEDPELEADSEAEGSDSEADKPAIDYDQKIPLADELGEMTVGELKDLAQDYHRRSANMERQEQDLIRDRREHAAMGDLIKQFVPREALEQFNRSYQDKLERASAELLELIPSWRDPAVFKSEREVLLRVMGDHGMRADKLQAMVDPDLIAFFRNYAIREDRFKKLRETGKKAGTGKQPVTGRRAARRRSQQGAQNREKQLQAAARSRSNDQKAAAISTLLGG